MCFSAEASFAAGAVLLIAGGASLKVVKNPAHYFFAAIPLIFSLQQFTEGFVWLSLTDSEWIKFREPAKVLFLVFAQVVWPVWVPLAMRLMETDPARKKLLNSFLVMGSLVAVFLGISFLFYPITAEISGHHIRYKLEFPFTIIWFTGVLYFIPTVISTIISGVKKVPLLGLVILISYIVSQLLFRGYVISVWCYFAAVISVMVFWIVKTSPAVEKEPNGK